MTSINKREDFLMKKTSLDKNIIEDQKEFEMLKEKLEKKYSCYVLLTCSDPNEKGNMNVEMSYNGDDVLASYLLQDAQNIFDDKIAKNVSG